MKTRPYVIVTPSWCASPGVRVLHMLCHELNSLGLDASLLLTGRASTGPDALLDPALHTPVINPLMQRHWEAINADAIVLYTDGVAGNPFQAHRVIRYVMGREQPQAEPAPGEYHVYHSRSLAARRQAHQHVLYLPPLDLGLFHDKGVAARDQDMLWLGEGMQLGADAPTQPPRIADDWLASGAELAAQLRRTRYLHSYEAGALVNLAAVLCGAVVILRPLGQHPPRFSRAELDAHEAGSGGMAFGDSPFEIERALRTRQELVENLRYQQASLRQRLLDFVHETQLHFK